MCSLAFGTDRGTVHFMRDLLLLTVHLVVTFAKLLRRRIAKLGVIIKTATLHKFHKALVNRKYQLLFSSSTRPCKPGAKGPSPELIAAMVEMRRRNPRIGFMRIAQQISYAFGLDIDKDVVRRVLAKHYRPGDSDTDCPSWLTFIGNAKDSLWSFHRWLANLRVLDIDEIKPVPSRRAGEPAPALAALDQHAWQQHCRGLFHPPIAT